MQAKNATEDRIFQENIRRGEWVVRASYLDRYAVRYEYIFSCHGVSNL